MKNHPIQAEQIATQNIKNSLVMAVAWLHCEEDGKNW